MLGPDGSGFDIMMSIVLPYFQLMNAAFSIGTMEAATAKAAAHVAGARFEHLGQTLSDLPTIRAYVARMRVKTDMARALLLDALDAIERTWFKREQKEHQVPLQSKTSLGCCQT
jgi:alkylation response protein AidB-like acyl-CoA dehydrogenase